jgi:hypothetical protein
VKPEFGKLSLDVIYRGFRTNSKVAEPVSISGLDPTDRYAKSLWYASLSCGVGCRFTQGRWPEAGLTVPLTRPSKSGLTVFTLGSGSG